jgi:hypothetical protein
LFSTFSVGAAVACNIFAGTAAAGTLILATLLFVRMTLPKLLVPLHSLSH